MAIRIERVGYSPKETEHCWRIHRPYSLGNPYTVEQYGREQAIRLYRKWLHRQWTEYQRTGNTTPTVKSLLRMLDYAKTLDLVLVCYCKSESRGETTPCHGDVIREVVTAILEKGAWE